MRYETLSVIMEFMRTELKLILNSRRIALQIVELLKEDERINNELNY